MVLLIMNLILLSCAVAVAVIFIITIEWLCALWSWVRDVAGG